MKPGALLTGLSLAAIAVTGAGASGLFSYGDKNKKEKPQNMSNEILEKFEDSDTLTKSYETEDLKKESSLRPEDSRIPEINFGEKPGHYWNGKQMIFTGIAGKDYQLEDISKEECINKDGRYSLVDRKNNIRKCILEIKKG